jgi:hypothetical protein
LVLVLKLNKNLKENKSNFIKNSFAGAKQKEFEDQIFKFNAEKIKN